MSGGITLRFADSWVCLLFFNLSLGSQIGRYQVDFLCQLVHVDTVGREVPEHLDQLVREGVEVDVELAVCGKDC